MRMVLVGTILLLTQVSTAFARVPVAVPEPSTLALLGMGAVGLLLVKKRKK